MAGMSIGGLMSGLPVEDMIAQLMYLERQPVRHLEQKQEQATARSKAWENIRSQLRNLEGMLNDLRYSSGTAMFTATTSDTNVVTASLGTVNAENSFNINVISLAQANSWASDAFAATDQALNVTGTIDVNGETVTIDAADTLEDVRGKLNAALGDAGRAAIVQTAPGQYRLTLTASKTGTADAIVVQPGALSFTEIVPASNAVVTINGLQIERHTNTINDAVPGLSLTVNDVGTATVTVARDVDGITRKLESFVKAYNDLASDLHRRLYFQPNPANTGFGRDDSAPVQRTDPLYGDSALRSLQQQLQQMLHTPVTTPDGKVTLQDLGISGAGWGEAGFREGHLKLDKEALANTLAEAPEKLTALFTGTNGLATRLHDVANSYTQAGGVIAIKMEETDESIRAIGRRIQQLQYRLEQRELMLRNQFTQLEMLMSQGQTQMAWLANQLGSLPR